MTPAISISAYIASVLILSSYFAMVKHPKQAPLFHWANAIGCLPIIASEILAHAWPPMVLTVSFGVIGWYGAIKDWRGLTEPSIESQLRYEIECQREALVAARRITDQLEAWQRAHVWKV